ncbi:HD domain-containing protein [Hydrogenothermus marinus]|uniref:tRNA nucleotidyltransferase-like protein n=1 Tax=Hydrogenothermus marinus TaxID=133270 RepID=A0A3M0BRI1_9AQUI|nr:hypothetical protein [Hydrogenothermus marinus]RMA97105.1 tRNA nucleotidyltransferase-like protein [Hydrogenothermus marinus]
MFCNNLIKGFQSLEKLFINRENLKKEKLNLWLYENKDRLTHTFLILISKINKKEAVDFIKQIQDYYFNIYQKQIREEPFLSGKEIIEIFNLKPSPLVGKLKDSLLKAQIKGKIKTKRQAVEYIKSLLDNSTT